MQKKQTLLAGKFLLGIGVLFLLFNYAFSLVPLQVFEQFYAAVSLEILKLFGFSGTIQVQEPVLVFLDGFSAPLGFSYLCTGLLELSLVWAAVLASFEISLKKRLIGVVAGTVTLVVFNFARIVLSVLVISRFGLDAGSFSHDIFFRFFLFLTIAGYYYAWLKWASRQ